MNLPATYSVTFNRKLLRQGVNWVNPIFGQEDPPKTGVWMSYTSPCSGDSGSPQMLFVVEQKDPKFVLAAIYSTRMVPFPTTGGPDYAAPCGTSTENTRKSHPDEEDILKNIGISVKITYPPISQWIEWRSESRS